MSATAIRSETAIRFDQVSKGFGETMALDDVSLDVPRGAFVRYAIAFPPQIDGLLSDHCPCPGG